LLGWPCKSLGECDSAIPQALDQDSDVDSEVGNHDHQGQCPNLSGIDEQGKHEGEVHRPQNLIGPMSMSESETLEKSEGTGDDVITSRRYDFGTWVVSEKTELGAKSSSVKISGLNARFQCLEGSAKQMRGETSLRTIIYSWIMLYQSITTFLYTQRLQCLDHLRPRGEKTVTSSGCSLVCAL